MVFERFYNSEIAQASFLIGCAQTGDAIIVDATRDIALYMAAAARHKLKIAAVTETHIHADYVSGSRELAQETGAKLYLSNEGGPDWQYAFAQSDGATLIGNGDEISVGNVTLRAVHTPGHTPEHLSFLVIDRAASEEPLGVLSGDFIFAGDVGRPDLLEVAAGVQNTMAAGASTLFQSLQRFKSMPERLLIWPGHGAGSACGKALGGVPVTSLGYERLTSPTLQIESESEFVAEILSGQPEPPAYFGRMKQVNREGPSPARPKFALRALAHLDPNIPILDVRTHQESLAKSLPKALLIPIDSSFAKWAGSILEPGQAFQIIANSEEDALRAQRTLLIIGLEGAVGWIPWSSVSSQGLPFEVVDGTKASQMDDRAVLDVRGTAELPEGVVPGSTHVPLVYLPKKAAELIGRKWLVHCAGGSRAVIAASYLRHQGIDAVAIADKIGNILQAFQMRSNVKSGVEKLESVSP